jgi:hypothetical protein
VNPIDWQAVRADYESGQFSQSALERKYNVSRQAIKKRANKEHWVSPQNAGYRSQKSTTQKVQHRDVNATMRAFHAMKMISEGATYEDAAKRAGYGSRGACFHAVQRELERSASPNAENFRKLMSYRLDRLLSAVWPLAVPESPDESIYDLTFDDDNDENYEDDNSSSFIDKTRENGASKKSKTNLFAVDRALAIIKSQRELWGIDKPIEENDTGAKLLIMEVPEGYLGNIQLPPEVQP